MAKLLLSKSDEEYLEKCATQLNFSYGIIVGQVSVCVGSVGGVLHFYVRCISSRQALIARCLTISEDYYQLADLELTTPKTGGCLEAVMPFVSD